MPKFNAGQQCPPAGNINFFSSGNYQNGSYSCTWDAKNLPEPPLDGKRVWQSVLEKFNITVSSEGGIPETGTLPGLDIKNMDAIQAIRLSLSEALLDGIWWELYEDGEGAVYFQQVFENNGAPPDTVTLDIRLCVPSASVDNVVDMVIVRGYDPPPCRIVRPEKVVIPTGGKVLGTETLLSEVANSPDAFIVNTVESFNDLPCHGGILKNSVQKTYKDPLDDVTQFSPQGAQFYDVKAFESVIGYVHIVDGPPTDPSAAARVKYTFSENTTLYKDISFPTMQEATATNACTQNLPQGGGISYYTGSIEVTTPEYSDRYGTPWPFVIAPTRLLCTAYKIEEIIDLRAFAAQANSPGPGAIIYVSPVKQMLTLSEGSQWVYSRTGPNSFDIEMFYQPRFESFLWDEILSLVSANPSIRYSDGQPYSNNKIYTEGGSGTSILGNTGDLGYLVDRMYLAMLCDRPSVTVEDADGEAAAQAAAFNIKYRPIIIEDRPAEIAYKHRTEGSKIVDQSQDIPDNDPTTCQAFGETDLNKMIDLQQGNVQEVTLPFCKDGPECLTVAETLFDYMDQPGQIQTFVLTCGPNDEPKLGQAVTDFDASLRIESISYSYSDGSAYTVEVTLGPVFANIGSFNAGFWIKKTEDVSRKGIIRWTGGDGANYRVMVQGLGEYNAINGTDSIFYVGEVVDVTIKNNPVEA